MLSQPTTAINVEALPMEIPESIEVDVSAMEMGDTLRLEDVKGPRRASPSSTIPHETVIATVSAPLARGAELEARDRRGPAAEGLGDDVEVPEGLQPRKLSTAVATPDRGLRRRSPTPRQS